MTRLTTLALALGLLALPGLASGAELPGTLVSASEITPPNADHRAAWESLLRERRAARLAGLAAYADAGAFPRKPGVPGWHHQFLDANGTPCAVASMIIHAGHADLVQATAATDNDVVLSEVEGGPLLDWVATSGFTIEEIAIIQEPGFEAELPIDEFPAIAAVEPPPSQLAAQAEQARIRGHLAATLTLLQVDTESAIAKAMDRLGDRVLEAPPADETLTLAATR